MKVNLTNQTPAFAYLCSFSVAGLRQGEKSLQSSVVQKCNCALERGGGGLTHSGHRFPPHFWKVNTEIPECEATDLCQKNIQKPLFSLQRLFVFPEVVVLLFIKRQNS